MLGRKAQESGAITDVIKGRANDQTLEKQLREHGSDPSLNDRVKL